MSSAAHPLRRVVLAWLPAVAYMTLIWVLSSGPVNLPIDRFPFKDKGVHVVEYGTLAVLGAYAIRHTWPGLGLLRALLWAALLTFCWGFSDELHQAFVPGRDSSVFDLLADAVGAFVGISCFALVARLWRRPARASQQ